MKKIFKVLIWSSIVTGVFISIIYYRYFLFSPDFNKPVDAVISDISEKIDIKIPLYQVPVDAIQVDNIASGHHVNGVPAVISEKNQVQDGASVNEDDVQNVEQEVTEPQASEEVNSAIPGSEVTDSGVADSQLSLSDIVSAVKDTVNETLDVFRKEREQQSEQFAADNASALSASELLFKARLAYWNRDLKSAENTYIKLTEMVDDPNAYGELGNLYYMQSKWKKAGDAYYHAAIKLKDIKQLDQAYHLLRIIRGLDTDTANKLQIELQQSS
ncbi:MAG TPA: hypothetical protein ENJ08_15470 [Gammaproteobacteria bacterium]|nr:hypothetical protein [Gammaproteobacteria bacterium]